MPCGIINDNSLNVYILVLLHSALDQKPQALTIPLALMS